MENRNSAPPDLPADYIYTKNYCEENVYLLCQEFLRRRDVCEGWKIWAVFISNETQTVALWEQKAAREAGAPVVWDYHVIIVLESKRINKPNNLRKQPVHSMDCCRESCETQIEGRTEAGVWVYDFDTLIQPIPCQWNDWVAKSFPYELMSQYKSLFRLIRGEDFINWFASDRSHMLLPSTNGQPPSYISPPPTYDPICGDLSKNTGETHNLMKSFVCMNPAAKNTFGEVLTLEEVIYKFSERSLVPAV